MTTVTTTMVGRSGPAVRAVLAEVAPEECAQFEAELRAALAQASADLDLAPVGATIDRWHTRATILANPLTDDERALVEQGKAGDFAGFQAQDEHGNWVTL